MQGTRPIFFEKSVQIRNVSCGVRIAAGAVGGPLHGEHLLLGAALLIVLQPHGVGHQLVFGAMDEEEGEGGPFQRFLAGGSGDGVSADDPGPKVHGREHGEDGHLVGIDQGRGDHVPGGMIGGIRDDAPGVGRQVLYR